VSSLLKSPMNSKCLYCYQPLDEAAPAEFHERCSLEFFGSKIPPVFDYSMDEMSELAKNVVERSVAVPGVQPKLSLSLVKEPLADGPRGRLTVVGAQGGNYIFKPPSAAYPEMPQNEHVTMRIAEKAYGLKTVPSSLIRLKSGELAYITKRIDRTAKGEKIHMLDMFQILEAFDKYRSSVEKVGKALGRYSGNTLLDQLYYFELTLFSYLCGNNDMHLKNFSMIHGPRGWTLAPAYDLLNVQIVNPADKEETALTLEGKKSNFRLANFTRLGEGLGLNARQIQNTYDRFVKNRQEADQWLKRSFLSVGLITAYQQLITERYRLFR